MIASKSGLDSEPPTYSEVVVVYLVVVMAECLSPVSVAGGPGDEDESAQLLANALKKMDGLIGDFR